MAWTSHFQDFWAWFENAPILPVPATGLTRSHGPLSGISAVLIIRSTVYPEWTKRCGWERSGLRDYSATTVR